MEIIDAEVREYLRMVFDDRPSSEPVRQRAYLFVEGSKSWSICSQINSQEDDEARWYLIQHVPIKATPDAVKSFLLGVLQSRVQSESIREAAAYKLGFITPPEYFDDMKDVLYDYPSKRIERAIVYSFGYFNRTKVARRAVGALRRVLKSSSFDHFVRASAAESLGAIGHRTAVTDLIAALGSNFPDIRFFSARALGWIKDERAVTALKLMAETDEGFVEELGGDGYWVRNEAIEALGSIESRRRKKPKDRTDYADGAR